MVKTCDELRRERQRRGWTLPQLAEKMHVSPPSVGSWERGTRKPSIDQVQHWAGAFGLRLVLVPAGADIDYGRIAVILDTLRALADIAPDLDEVLSAFNILAELRNAELPDESEAVFA
jgi:transcriptional regulator with XRE-family HTH domain